MEISVEISLKCTEIAEVKKASLESKKKLAEETKGFLGKPDEEKLSGFTSLLKLYMGEIDALSRRAKTSETFVLSLGGRLESEVKRESMIGNQKIREVEEMFTEKFANIKQKYENQITDLRNQAETASNRLADTCQELEIQGRNFENAAHEKDMEISFLHRELQGAQTGKASGTTDAQVHKALVEASNFRVRELEAACDNMSRDKAQKDIEISSLKDEVVREKRKLEAAVEESMKTRAEMERMRETENLPEAAPEIPMLVEKHEGALGNLKKDISDRDRKIKALEREIMRLEENTRGVPDNVTVQAVSAAQTQRDRFRSRVLELEAERDELRRAVNRKNFTLDDVRRPAEKPGLFIFSSILVNRKLQLALGVYVVTLHLLVLSSLARLTSLDQLLCCVFTM